jgi:hypothetical protein
MSERSEAHVTSDMKHQITNMLVVKKSACAALFRTFDLSTNIEIIKPDIDGKKCA